MTIKFIPKVLMHPRLIKNKELMFYLPSSELSCSIVFLR